jgi:hypothetical protein
LVSLCLMQTFLSHMFRVYLLFLAWDVSFGSLNVLTLVKT